MESKFRSNVVSEGSWIGQSFFVISIRGYTPPLRATKIYTSSPIPPRGIWHMFARHEAYNYGLDPENRFLEGRVGVPSIVPYFEPDFCRRIPLKDSFPSSFLARTHYHTSLKSFFFFYLSYPRRVEGKYRGTFSNSRCQFLRNREFDSQTDSNILHRSSPRVSRIINSFPWPSNYISPCYVIRIEYPICTCVVKSIVTRSRNIFHAEKSKERSIFLLFAFTIKRTNTHSRPIGNRCSSNLYLYLISNHDIRYHL